MTADPRPLRVSAVSLDCADHAALAAFYAELFDGTVLWSHGHASAVDVGGLVLVAQEVEDHREPTWPHHSIVHLDVTVDADALDAQAERALGLGARLADPQPDTRWRVLLDPAGHPFCLTPFAP
ncbi:VOC family protein [Terracoccus sp. 273MFTsu3.1]|uniref:VOC family protein n=1 Tax=Terracoccus sp. 273MFTsu3.1 TaxID=1172188 RepID=UPI00036F6A76|nr:VOC family protein [Terracoccus sp. 273MFTsu3.1]